MASGQEPGQDSCEKQGFKLTDEERQVLKECRRASLMRGIPLAFGAWFVVRYYGRRVAPTSHFGRSWSFYSVAAFIGGLFAGVNSYKHKCFQKIMQLEHSTLKDQVMKMTELGAGQSEQFSHQYDTPSQKEGQLGGRQRRRRSLEDHSHWSRQAEESHGSHPQEEPKPSSREYHPTTPQLESKEQPSAFDEHTTPGPFGDSDRDEGPSSSQHPGKTFDEIRAESRKRQQFEAKDYRQREQRGKKWGESEGQWWRDQEQAAEAGKKRPRERRNKYGDIIIDDDDK